MRFPLPYQQVFGALLHGLTACGMTVTRSDPASGTITATTKINLRTWGENITVRSGALEDGSTAVQIDSVLRFGLASWGKHDRNFKQIFEAVSVLLQVSPEPLSSPSPPTADPSGSGTG